MFWLVIFLFHDPIIIEILEEKVKEGPKLIIVINEPEILLTGVS